MRYTHSLIVPLTLVFLMACGGDRETVTLDPQPPSPSASAACRASATSICARVEECGALLPLLYGTREECEAAVTTTCSFRYEGPGAATSVAPCDLKDVSCEALDAARLRALVPAAMPSAVLLRHCAVTPGRRAEGEPCLAAGDCETGACAGISERRCGHCAQPGAEGADCRPGTDECALGLQCANRRCVRLRFTGEACSVEAPCAAGNCTDGVCRPYQQKGEHCDEEGPLCDELGSLACDRDRTCASFTIVKSEEACDHRPVFDTADVGDRVCPMEVERLVRHCSDATRCPSSQCIGGQCRSSCQGS